MLNVIEVALERSTFVESGVTPPRVVDYENMRTGEKEAGADRGMPSQVWADIWKNALIIQGEVKHVYPYD